MLIFTLIQPDTPCGRHHQHQNCNLCRNPCMRNRICLQNKLIKRMKSNKNYWVVRNPGFKGLYYATMQLTSQISCTIYLPETADIDEWPVVEQLWVLFLMWWLSEIFTNLQIRIATGTRFLFPIAYTLQAFLVRIHSVILKCYWLVTVCIELYWIVIGLQVSGFGLNQHIQ